MSRSTLVGACTSPSGAGPVEVSIGLYGIEQPTGFHHNELMGPAAVLAPGSVAPVAEASQRGNKAHGCTKAALRLLEPNERVVLELRARRQLIQLDLPPREFAGRWRSLPGAEPSALAATWEDTKTLKL